MQRQGWNTGRHGNSNEEEVSNGGQALGRDWDADGIGANTVKTGERNKVGTKVGMGETGTVDEGWALGGMRVGRGLGDGDGTRGGGSSNGGWAMVTGQKQGC